MTRVIMGLFAGFMAFFHSKHKQEPDVDQLIIDAYNKSRETWVSKGWVEPR